MLGVPFLDKAISGLFKPHSLDDPVDRLNYFVTSVILAFFALMVSAKQYVGSPIQCWCPNEFRGGWEQYAEDYCFIQNSYYVPMTEEIPEEKGERQERELGYYQWVPICLALQAIMFYIPNWLWKTLNRQSGVDIESCVADARKLRAMHHKDRKDDLDKLSTYLFESLDVQQSQCKNFKRFFCFRFGTNLGSYVTWLYLFIKFLYMANIILQFVILNHFLGTGYMFWGVQMMTDVWTGREWEESGFFPRVTLCDFGVRKLGNMVHYTIQCVLMINMFNEKIYLFLWFWFALVFVCTLVNFLYCIANLVIPQRRESSARNWLYRLFTNNQSEIQYRDANSIRNFTHKALKTDGILVLRFIEGHAGAMVVKDIATALFDKYMGMLKAQGPPSFPYGMEGGLRENLYEPTEKQQMQALLQPDGKTTIVDFPTKDISGL